MKQPGEIEPIKVLVVAGVVLYRDGKVLLVQEKQPKAYGKWNLPAGKVDAGETIEQAAIREAKEECGYDVALDYQLPIVHTPADSPVLHAFAAHITGGELKFPKSEILDAKWFTPAEVQAMAADLRRPDYILGAIHAVAPPRPTQFVYPEPTKTAFDKVGHTGKFFGTQSSRTNHLIIETADKLTVSLREGECEFNYYIIDGSGEFTINGQTHPVKTGDLIVIPPGNIFTWRGHLKMLLINTPHYSPDQETELPKN
jgi:ADP-ribose pyrophosphatase YjhB (NUDIX family)/mannose-6-phosphate isomerase-like protein (cupin superfamily)